MTHKREGVRLLRMHEAAILIVAAIVGLFVTLNSHTMRPAMASSETRFVETSASGLKIVPASCPSVRTNPDYPHDTCSIAPPDGGCTITAIPSNVMNGQSATLMWSVANKTVQSEWWFLTYTGTPANILLTPGGPVARSGSMTVSPTQTTTYTLSGTYQFSGGPSANVPGGPHNFSCSTTVTSGSCAPGTVLVNGQCVMQCPAGQHAVGNICVCDATNAPPNGAGQCTQEVCPEGFQFDPVTLQCVAVNQCMLPALCSDDTHVLNQCTGQTTDCVATYGQGYHCVDGACRAPAPPIASITAVPSLLPQGNTTNVSWTSTNTASCTVTGNNGDGGQGWSGRNGSHISSAIESQTIYTLVCNGWDGSTITRTVTVNIIPREIED